MLLPRKEIFEFGEFRLDVSERTIERIDGGHSGTLTEKAFQALTLLVRRGGHLVSKDELIGFVWPDTIVEDNNLEKSIHHLRHFLGEAQDGNKYIETVRKHGYRFVGNIRVVEVSGTWLPETFRTDNGKEGSADPIGDQLAEPQAESANTVAAGQRAVEEARDSFRSRVVMSAIILALIGSTAGLGYYLFIRPSREANTSEFQTKRGTKNDEAHRFYLMAMNLSEKRGVPNVRKALEYLDKAVALDPNYALAWANKALTHVDVVAHGDGDPHENYASSMKAIRNALELDPNLSEAHSALCYNKSRYEYDAVGAETACKQAVELNPNSPVAHKTFANFLYSRGRLDEAIVEIRVAMDLQPVSYRNQQMYALTLYFARRYAEAEDQFKRLIELNPDQPYIHTRLIKVLEEQGKESEAFEYLIEMLTIQKADIDEIQRFKTTYETSGWRGVVIEQVKTAEASKLAHFFHLACLYSKLGYKDQAFESLEEAYQQRNFQIAILRVEPQLDALRDDPRFEDLLRRVEGK